MRDAQVPSAASLLLLQKQLHPKRRSIEHRDLSYSRDIRHLFGRSIKNVDRPKVSYSRLPVTTGITENEPSAGEKGERGRRREERKEERNGGEESAERVKPSRNGFAISYESLVTE